MSYMAIASGLTIDEFERLPLALVKNKELVNGELVDVSGNTEYHNSLRDLLIELLRPLVRGRRLGNVIAEQEFEFEQNVHGPDVSFYGPRKLALVNRKRRVQPFVPDLAIEIVSENDRFNNLMDKAERYLKCGTQEVWILAPETRQAFVISGERREFVREDQPFETRLIPGFSIRLGELFDRA
jgi:Uma2 family endonuclease